MTGAGATFAFGRYAMLLTVPATASCIELGWQPGGDGGAEGVTFTFAIPLAARGAS